MSYPHQLLNHSSGPPGHTPDADLKKRMPSCDLCRLRKIKCVKTDTAQCEGCSALEQECEYTHIRRKPGPPNKFAKPKLEPTLPIPPHSSHASHPSHPQYPLRISTDPPSWLTPAHAFQYPLTAPPITFNHSQILADQTSDRAGLPYLPLAPSVLTDPSTGIPQEPVWAWENGWDAMDSGTDNRFPKLPPLVPQARFGWGHSDTSSTPLAAVYRTEEDSRKRRKAIEFQKPLYRLEDEIEWSVMMRILHAFHAHLYPLMPIVHWPTFSQQLINRADEHSESWRAFLFALVAYSIIQLPRSTISFMSVEQLRPLHQRCFQASQKLQNRKYKELKLVDIKTLYCQHVYLGSLGDQGAAVIALAKSVSLSFMMGLHDESRLPVGISPIDREVRRRVFWLIYGSDRTDSALAGDPLLISDDELNLPLPLTVDDNLLTTSGVFDQPPQTTSVMAGFHYNSRLFRLLGSILTALKPLPQGTDWTRPSSQYHEELESLLDDLPGPFQLSTRRDIEPRPEAGYPEADQAAFASCRANLLITQAMTRFAIRSYAKAIGDEDTEGDCKDWAEKDVLRLLERMSPESLAANGNAMRVKLLFVTSALMEKYPVNTDGHNYVADFLNVYTRAAEEQSLAMLEVDTLMGSRESSPDTQYRARGQQSFERTLTVKEGG